MLDSLLSTIFFLDLIIQAHIWLRIVSLCIWSCCWCDSWSWVVAMNCRFSFNFCWNMLSSSSWITLILYFSILNYETTIATISIRIIMALIIRSNVPITDNPLSWSAIISCALQRCWCYSRQNNLATKIINILRNDSWFHTIKSFSRWFPELFILFICIF